MPFKIVISDPKTRRAYQKEAPEDGFLGKKLGDKVAGDLVGLVGFELELTGGSDKDGFPMRRDMEGQGKKKILITPGVGLRSGVKGERKKKSVRGNTISKYVSQINVKILKYGAKSVEESLGIKTKEEKPAEAKELSAEEKQEKMAEEAQKLSEQMTDKPQRASKAA